MDNVDDGALTSTDAVGLAREVATRAHAGQVDKAGEPYIGHPRRVARRAGELAGGRGSGFRDAAEAVGWLHDVVEDTELDGPDLRRLGFSDEVVAAVLALTRRVGEPEPDYAARVAANELAMVVKRADLADNTDPARTALLDEETRVRLAEKYRVFRGLLDAASPTTSTDE
ncbi:HD domain-containing protein [Propionibacterium freudenreichii]|uniref:HD domain-containing protein n=1 Tax=Propionibacterium freudenreichii TaxID=1744 RepID=UPI000BC30564|nr:HD domain-containing protein [Propionibacterium freudenreichii]MDK9294414.1 bifunctional (p)ppGpp synthetase/guanosine-3',5'-bis(diphosphate) 3'-pyrophosphohydrolase [Propionibacterium freudenreichii]MDK9360290.1 bifunctional (p)ppGpp synthetase/guanosine-3',5'-bis(diphosphate) 3'-pyrophosphohydrolase [Propionibacterium freudenreichii]MDK9639607.1 bifunctional (p)ppGpp synthetase/guanosine-3',5'-bis(diphosphate) 3'-pyrophosphohydrolase [Propionibacterium freudenreichii]MDK9659869.1 bifunctio